MYNGTGTWKGPTGTVYMEPCCIVEIMLPKDMDTTPLFEMAEAIRSTLAQECVLVTLAPLHGVHDVCGDV